MTARETLKEVRELTEAVVGLSLSNEQNFPTTEGNLNSTCEISVNNAGNMSAALKNVAYKDIYRELSEARCFNVKLLDGALLSLRYRFKSRTIFEHSLSYFPSPDLEHFQNDPEVYLEDEIYADIIAKNIVPFPIRFDFSADPKKFVEIHHPYSHLTLGQYANCRIPVCSPMGPLAFGAFVLRNFYNTAFRKYSEEIPTSSRRFSRTISVQEAKIPHFVCS